jgi:hypothetical protein
LFFVSALAYLPNITKFTLYKDDWYYIVDGFFGGPKIFHDMFFVGFRYGIGIMQQEVKSFVIDEDYWGDIIGSYAPKVIQVHWLELVAGVKAEITKSIFLGFSARIRYKLFSTKAINYGYTYPGFGNGEKKLNIGFNYSLYYQIPLMKVKNKK